MPISWHVDTCRNTNFDYIIFFIKLCLLYGKAPAAVKSYVRCLPAEGAADC